MKTEPPSTTEGLLDQLAQLSGVISAAIADTQNGLAESATCQAARGTPPFSTEQRVLNEAMLSTAKQLAERAGVGDLQEIHHGCTQGGLLLVRIDPHRWLILHYAAAALPALLRVALREAAKKLALLARTQPPQQQPHWISAPVPNLGELPKILFREQKGLIQVESTVYNSPNPA